METILSIENLNKRFGPIHAVKNVSLEIQKGNVYGILGPNGSGKSTLLKMIAGITELSSGSIELKTENQSQKNSNYRNSFGFVSPYLKLYDEFNAIELVDVVSKLRCTEYDKQKTIELLKIFDIFRHRIQPVRTFSSGMKQRLQFIICLMHSPKILLLDEPSTNLDKTGIKIIEKQIAEHIQNGGAAIIATNESREATLCHSIINLKRP